MSEGEILENERKGKILSFGGYLYNEHSKNGDNADVLDVQTKTSLQGASDDRNSNRYL